MRAHIILGFWIQADLSLQDLTQRELMGLHAEILSLCERLGISYKDACHRLYMTEWEKLKLDELTNKALLNVKIRARASLAGFQQRLNQLRGQGNVTDGGADADRAADRGAGADP